MAARKTSRAGNEAGDRASVLVDAIVAIFILCLALVAVSFAVGAITPALRSTYAAIMADIDERGSHESHAFDRP